MCGGGIKAHGQTLAYPISGNYGIRSTVVKQKN